MAVRWVMPSTRSLALSLGLTGGCLRKLSLLRLLRRCRLLLPLPPRLSRDDDAKGLVMSVSTVPTVRMGPRESRGFVLGLRIPQVVLILMGVGSLAGGLAAGSQWSVLGVAGTATFVAMALLPVRGRQLDELSLIHI